MTALSPIDRSQAAPQKEEAPPKSKLNTSTLMSRLYNHPAAAAACTYDGYALPSTKYRAKQIGGAAGGAVVSALASTTGPMVTLHEVVGHGMLGYDLTYRYGSNGNPTFQVDGWDNFKALGHSSSFGDGCSNFFRWISGYDIQGDGFAGFANRGQPLGPSEIGKAMGSDGQSAWISVAGSLPALAVDTIAVVGGMQLRNRHPVIGNMMVGFGLTDNMVNAVYPISAAMMNSSEMQAEANHGHDFANFSVKMSNITGLSAEAIAISTAVAWTAFVPIVAGLAYLHSKSNAGDVVPDALAMRHWIQKATRDPQVAKELNKHLGAFRGKKELLELSEKALSGEKLNGEEIAELQSQSLGFISYLLDKVPPATLATCKNELLKSWETNIPEDKIQTALTIGAVAGSAAAVAAKFMTVLAETSTPSLQAAATAMTYASPAFVSISVLSAGYELYKDLQCPDSVIPKKAKMLSAARLIVAVAYAALFITALFVPGLNFILIGAMVFGCITSILLSYYRAQIIKRQFALIKALEPETWNVMNALWLEHRKKPAGTKMSRPLAHWVDTVLPVQKKPALDLSGRPTLFDPKKSLNKITPLLQPALRD